MDNFIKAFIYLRYLPVVIFKIKNWPVFVMNYFKITKSSRIFEFRNGLKIKAKGKLGAGTVGVVFIKKDYGEVKNNSNIIDIGANIGAYSLFAAQSEGTKVFAFEPAMENFNQLKENIKLNNFENKVFVFNLAVGAEEGKRELYLGESPYHSFCPLKDSPFNALYGNKPKEKEQKSVEVGCTSLKKIFDLNNISYCDILKIDAEGAEFEILYSLPEDYFKRIREIRMEYHNHLNGSKNNVNYLKNFLENKRYKIIKSKKGSEYQGNLWAKRM